MKNLQLHELFTRQEVQQIFEPDYNFVKSTGTWGIQGIVRVNLRPKDYVFFVSLGQSQADHVFEEGIDDQGVLTWQSQPRMSFDSKEVVDFISHDDTTSIIHLFFDGTGKKPKGSRRYEYLGRLRYLEHDPELERPVYFKFLLLDFDGEQQESTDAKTPHPAGKLNLTDNKPKANRVRTSREFRAIKEVNYAERDARNRELGLAGEKLVLEYEIDKLESAGLEHLVDRVIHTSVVEGDGAGYDIRSFDLDGKDLFIEVKTTKGGINTDFFISPNELELHDYTENTLIYRVFNYGKDNQEFYVIDDIESLFDLKPTGFKAKIK